jgi:Tfp pilus assembly PilM family ATPase
VADSIAAEIQRSLDFYMATSAPTEKVVVEAREVDALLLQTRAAQLAVALGLALRKEKETHS